MEEQGSIIKKHYVVAVSLERFWHFYDKLILYYDYTDDCQHNVERNAVIKAMEKYPGYKVVNSIIRELDIK